MSVFQSVEEYDHWRAIVRLNPQRDPEKRGGLHGFFTYLERIAVLAGGMEPGTGMLGKDHAWDDTPRVRVIPLATKALPAPATAPTEDDEYADVEVLF